MPSGLRHVIGVGATVLLIGLAAPGTALAGGGGKCNASACKVYHEQDGPSAGRQHSQPSQPTGAGGGKGGGTGGGMHQSHQPKNLSRVLSQAGKDRGPLSKLLNDDVGSLRQGPATVASPSALGAAFDLGTGPAILLAVLLATAVVGLAARGGLRSRLQRRSTQ